MFPIFNVEFNEALKKYNSYNKYTYYFNGNDWKNSGLCE